MAQKTNPKALRIASNTRYFPSIWYSGYYFSQILEKDLHIQTYLKRVFKIFKLPQTQLSLCHFSTTTRISSFFCYPKKFRELSAKIFRIHSGLPLPVSGSELKNTTLSQPSLFSSMTSKKRANSLNSLTSLYTLHHYPSILSLPQTSEIQSLKSLPTIDFTYQRFCSRNSQKNSIDHLEIFSLFQSYLALQLSQTSRKVFSEPFKNTDFIQNFQLKPSLENSLSQSLNTDIEVIPFQSDFEWQSAQYFVDEIVYLLERRISFRQLKNRLVNQAMTNSWIQGIRITCSGRVGGKSKKSQRAKQESVLYGETSLHVFSCKVDYACGAACTPLGLTGIQVWICYK